jgi:hypothetical protein
MDYDVKKPLAEECKARANNLFSKAAKCTKKADMTIC